MLRIRGNEYNFKLDTPATMKRLAATIQASQEKKRILLESVDPDAEVDFEDIDSLMAQYESIVKLIDFLVNDTDVILGDGETFKILGVESREDISAMDILELNNEVSQAVQIEIRKYENSAKKLGLAIPIGKKGE